MVTVSCSKLSFLTSLHVLIHNSDQNRGRARRGCRTVAVHFEVFVSASGRNLAYLDCSCELEGDVSQFESARRPTRVSTKPDCVVRCQW